MNTSTTYSTYTHPSTRGSEPRLAAPIANAFAAAYSFVAAALASVMRPQQESPAASALRLRRYASQYATSMPSLASDLYAAADRHQESNQ